MIFGPPGPLFLSRESLHRVEANLAFDEALLDQAEDDGTAPALRLWENPGPAVVLGASSRLHAEVHLDACHADRVPIARRSSGGGTVLIGPGVLCVAVVLPIAAHPALAAVDTAQHHVLQAAATALRDLGRPVEVRGHGDLTLYERKISGSAQRRLRRHVLVHFTLLCDAPLDPISRYLALPDRQPSYRAGRPHHEFVANLDLPASEVSSCLLGRWTAGRTLVPISAPRPRIERVLADKIDRAGWVERF
jgi:lipoate-protein ligase A